VIAQSNILGMEIIVRNKLIVLEIEYIMQLSNNVCVQMIFFGMDLVVWLNLIVVVEKFGIKQVSNATVLHHLIMMEQIVSYVLMEKHGIKD